MKRVLVLGAGLVSRPLVRHLEGYADVALTVGDLDVAKAAQVLGGNERGRAFTVSQWEEYLERLRGHARALGVSARTIEYTLFHCHRKLQRGRLYD